MSNLPLSRQNEILVQETKEEVLIYDLKLNKVFCLNETSSIVYRACDGKTSFAELKSKYKFTDELIFLALDGLKKGNLLETDYKSPFEGMSRREVIKKVGLATMIALPVISSLSAPTPAMAQSGCGGVGCQPGGCQAVSMATTTFGSVSGTCSSLGADLDANCMDGVGFRCCSGNATASNCVAVSSMQFTHDCICV